MSKQRDSTELLGERIKELRVAKGMTLERVGDAVGVGKSTVRKWETGSIQNVGSDKIAKLAEVLDVSPMDLMGWCPSRTDGSFSSERPVSSFHERFSELCESNPYSDTELSRRLMVSKQAISAWKSGHRSPKTNTIIALAQHFDVDFKWLMGYNVNATPSKTFGETIKEMRRLLDTIEKQYATASNDNGEFSSEEIRLIEAYRLADPTYRIVATELLENHPMNTERKGEP